MISDTITQRATPADFVAQVKFNSDGLVPAVVQERRNGTVLMLAWMNEESLKRTIETGRTWFWSRSRKEFWAKGETSGDVQLVQDISIDCDGDTLLIEVEQQGKGACHTGNYSCFYTGLIRTSEASD